MVKLSDLLPTPSNWTYHTEEVEEIQLCPFDSEYYRVKDSLNGIPLTNLQKITRIQNTYLYHRYMLRKLEYETLNLDIKEMKLLHATGVRNIPSIIKNNLDWRLANRVKFGRGVSFSPSASYANRECSRNNGYNRAIIVANVLVGRTTCGSYHNEIPPNGYDTTTGNCNSVYVKYYDDEFYPAYVAYYDL